MEKTLKQQPSKLIKVVVFGPESTGKTTLSRQLATHYNTVWTTEFLRDFAQKKWDTEQKVCEPKDVIPIAKGQIALENKQTNKATNLLICDTDLLETKVYAETYFEGFNNPELDKAINENNYDIYLLTYIDTPWEADDLRDKPEQREEMFNKFEHALIKHQKPYVLLKGNKTVRLNKAISIINQLIDKKASIK